MRKWIVLVLTVSGDSGEDFTVEASDEVAATAKVLAKFGVATEDDLAAEHGLRVSQVVAAR